MPRCSHAHEAATPEWSWWQAVAILAFLPMIFLLLVVAIELAGIAMGMLGLVH